MKEILITSSVLIVALLFLRLLFARKVRHTLIYGAWILVALRLLIPVQIGQLDFSVLTAAKPLTETVEEISDLRVIGQNEREADIQVTKDYIQQDQTVFIPQVQEYIHKQQESGASAEEIASALVKTQGSQLYVPEMREQVAQQVAEQTDYVSIGQIAVIVWLSGGAVMAVWFGFVNLRHSLVLRKHREMLACESPIPVYVSQEVGSPCLVGFFRPAVYLTPKSTASEGTLRHVLTHELTHYRHGDHIWSLVRCICLCVYWFDPLVWLASYMSRRDCELACDESAVKVLGETERLAYGKTLLEVVSHASTPAQLLQTATSMNETKKQLKERVYFIVRKPKFSIVATICMVLVCAIVTGCVAAGPTNQQAMENAGETTQPSATIATTVDTKPTDPLPTEPEPTKPAPTEPVSTVATQPTEPEPTHPAQCEYILVEVIQEATCVEPEIVLYECVHCGNQTQQQNEKDIPHDYSKTAVTKKATCRSEGERSYICVMCGKKKFCETIPVSSEHDYAVVERQAINNAFAGYKLYRCKDCNIEKETYYGKKGDYDLDAITADMAEYVAQYGFYFRIISSDDLGYNEKPTRYSFTSCERMGGPEYLHAEVLKAVESWCKNRLASCEENSVDPSAYICELFLSAWNSGSLGGTFFSVYVATGYSNP